MTDAAAPDAAVAPPSDGGRAAAAPVTVERLRVALNGAPGVTDEQLAEYLDIALDYVVPLLKSAYRPDPDTGDYPLWPAALQDGLLLGAMLTARNREAPSAATTEGGYASVAQYGVPTPAVPPINWGVRIRPRILQFMDAEGMVG
jgi:hypothetical protein